MKKFILILMTVALAITASAQNETTSAHNCYNPDAIYQLSPTQNMWTFLKLDTRNGKITQVHFSVGDGDRGELTLNSLPLAYGEDAKVGRFRLYPTENIYNFILLDQIDGRTWQVQWSYKLENRGIVRIPPAFD